MEINSGEQNEIAPWTEDEFNSVVEFLNNFFSQQEPLGEEFKKVLNENIEDLYES